MTFNITPDSEQVSVEAIIGAVEALQSYMLETLANLFWYNKALDVIWIATAPDDGVSSNSVPF